jgi:hypothetical protein
MQKALYGVGGAAVVLAVAAGVAGLGGPGAAVPAASADALADAAQVQETAAADASSAYDALARLSPTPATLSADELDTVVGSYCYGGQVVAITAREVIEGSTGLSAAQNDDGTYAAPTADEVVERARNLIMAQVVDEQGIVLTEDEFAAYLYDSFGVSDTSTIAEYFGMEEAEARAVLLDAAALVKLRDQVIGTVEQMPTAPLAPEDGDATALTADYASYIVGLAGDAYDAQTCTWVDEESPYAQSLADSAFDGKEASYEAAQAAYYTAYYLYQETANAQLAEWQDYVDGYLGQVTVTVATLRS